MKEKNIFGERVKNLRKNRSLTQKQVASDLGLGQSAIANYEHGTRFPDERNLRLIAEYFNVSLDYLLDIKRVMSFQYNLDDIDEIKSRYGEFMINRNFKDALDLLILAQSRGVSLTVIFTSVILPLLSRMGVLWETGIMDVAEEHLISEEIERSLGILTYNRTSMDRKQTKIICTTAGAEMHRLTLKMISELLKNEGYTVMFLGINTPNRDLRELCLKDDIGLLILSAIMDSSVNSVNSTVKALRSEDALKSMKIIAGGPAFIRDTKAVETTEADYIVNDIADLITYINSNFS